MRNRHLFPWLILLCACASTTPAQHSESFLVVFPLEGSADQFSTVANRPYYRETKWRAPLRTKQLVRRVAKQHNLKQIDAWPIATLNVHCVLFETTADVDMPALFAALRSHDYVAHVQPNFEFEAMTSSMKKPYNDPLFELQYGKNAASLKSLHSVTRGESSLVGLIDSDVDLQHPDLAGQVAKTHALAGSSGLKNQLHGTAMAGIISALPDNGEGVVGLAPNAEMYVYAACRRDADKTLCRTFEIAKAIVHAIEDGVDVLNMSLAGPHDELLRQLLTKAAQAHGMTVIAANNAGNPARNFPADLEFVHAARDTESLWFARLAQMSTQAGGGYRVFYGASVASAGVAGVAALLRSKTTHQATNEILRDLMEKGCASRSVRDSDEEFELRALCD